MSDRFTEDTVELASPEEIEKLLEGVG